MGKQKALFHLVALSMNAIGMLRQLLVEWFQRD